MRFNFINFKPMRKLYCSRLPKDFIGQHRGVLSYKNSNLLLLISISLYSSASGLVSHIFDQPGVFYYSDQTYEAFASYMGVIVVLPKPAQHFFEVTNDGIKPGWCKFNKQFQIPNEN